METVETTQSQINQPCTDETAAPAAPTLPSVPTLGLRRSFEALRPFIDAVPDDELALMNVDVPAAVEVALKAVPRMLPLRSRLAAMPEFDLATFDRLPQLAAAASHAHMIWGATSKPEEAMPKLLERTLALRELLLSDGGALAHRGLLDGEKLKELRSPTGYRNAAYDLLKLVRLMRDHEAAIEGRTALSRDELDDAEATGEALVQALVSRDKNGWRTADAALVRQRAFTLLDRGYDEARRAVAYLRWREDDADDIAPSLRLNRSRRSPRVSESAKAPVTVTPSASGPFGPKGPASAPAGTVAAIAEPNPFAE